MLSKFEIIGISASLLCMAVALYLVRVETSLLSTGASTQVAQVAESGLVVVNDGENVNRLRADALLEASDLSGNLNKMVIDDIVAGSGAEAVEGSEVAVHYIGTLQNGYEFDNSIKRGEPFTFTIGEGQVIKGWEEGVVGMKVGGKRILVIPPELAYGDEEVGPIPADSILVFAIELLEVK